MRTEDLVRAVNFLRGNQMLDEVSADLVLQQIWDREAKIAKIMKPNEVVDLWAEYSRAYQNRYQTKPLFGDGKKVLGQAKLILKSVSGAEAKELVGFYLAHNGSFYTQQKHPIGLLLKDVQKLWTEMQTGQVTTPKASREAESLDASTRAARDYYKESGGG